MPFGDTKFVTLKLDEKQKKQFPDWAADTEHDIGLLLSDIASSGHKLTLSHSDKNNSFVCAVTCRDKDSSNFKCCVTSYHDVALTVILVALFKHFVILGDQVWENVNPEADWG